MWRLQTKSSSGGFRVRDLLEASDKGLSGGFRLRAYLEVENLNFFGGPDLVSEMLPDLPGVFCTGFRVEKAGFWAGSTAGRKNWQKKSPKYFPYSAFKGCISLFCACAVLLFLKLFN